jgi:hypothetical protein
MDLFSIIEFLFQVSSLKNAINTPNFVTASTFSIFKCQLNPYVCVDPNNLNAPRFRLNYPIIKCACPIHRTDITHHLKCYLKALFVTALKAYLVKGSA